jgi:D-sedoheptulose 7-phosphate isomerase
VKRRGGSLPRRFFFVAHPRLARRAPPRIYARDGAGRLRRIFSAAAAQQRFVSRHAGTLARVIDVTVEALARRRTLFFFGNGGSAADAQHLAAEFVNRYQLARAPLPALALTTDSSALTSIANDFGYDEVFAKQIQALARRGDVAFAISTSGNAANVLRAVDECRRRGVITVGLTGGTGGTLAERVDHLLCVDATRATARIQETHIVIGHALCELVELRLAERRESGDDAPDGPRRAHRPAATARASAKRRRRP